MNSGKITNHTATAATSYAQAGESAKTSDMAGMLPDHLADFGLHALRDPLRRLEQPDHAPEVLDEARHVDDEEAGAQLDVRPHGVIREPDDRLRVEELAQPPVVLLARHLQVVRVAEVGALELDLAQPAPPQPVVAAEQVAVLAQVDAREERHRVGHVDQADRVAVA